MMNFLTAFLIGGLFSDKFSSSPQHISDSIWKFIQKQWYGFSKDEIQKIEIISREYIKCIDKRNTDELIQSLKDSNFTSNKIELLDSANLRATIPSPKNNVLSCFEFNKHTLQICEFQSEHYEMKICSETIFMEKVKEEIVKLLKIESVEEILIAIENCKNFITSVLKHFSHLSNVEKFSELSNFMDTLIEKLKALNEFIDNRDQDEKIKEIIDNIKECSREIFTAYTENMSKTYSSSTQNLSTPNRNISNQTMYNLITDFGDELFSHPYGILILNIINRKSFNYFFHVEFNPDFEITEEVLKNCNNNKTVPEGFFKLSKCIKGIFYYTQRTCYLNTENQALNQFIKEGFFSSIYNGITKLEAELSNDIFNIIKNELAVKIRNNNNSIKTEKEKKCFCGLMSYGNNKLIEKLNSENSSLNTISGLIPVISNDLSEPTKKLVNYFSKLAALGKQHRQCKALEDPSQVAKLTFQQQLFPIALNSLIEDAPQVQLLPSTKSSTRRRKAYTVEEP